MGGRIPPNDRTIVLASRSPRRRALLESAGWQVVTRPAPVDDGDLHAADRSPATWTQALAWLKARAVADLPETTSGERLLAADTICVVNGDICGQPVDRTAARAMLHAMRNQTHDVWTGMCLHFAGGARFMGAVATPVEVGAISDDAIEHYLDTNQWQGKAGAYNLSERIDAGWPVTCHGEPEAVMGLSMQLLDQLLAEAAA